VRLGAALRFALFGFELSAAWLSAARLLAARAFQRNLLRIDIGVSGIPGCERATVVACVRRLLTRETSASPVLSKNRSEGGIRVAVPATWVREIFKERENGDGAAFFEHVAADVDWTVMGTHPRAGHYRSKKAFREGTFDKLNKVLPGGVQLHVQNVLVDGDEAVVELPSLATAKNGMRFDNWHCWIVYFERDVIVRVRAYLDSAMVARLFNENPI
jgi:hypothetical protein